MEGFLSKPLLGSVSMLRGSLKPLESSLEEKPTADNILEVRRKILGRTGIHRERLLCARRIHVLHLPRSALWRQPDSVRPRVEILA